MQKDIVIPVVFPDYKITVEVKKMKVDVLPWVDFDNFTSPAYKDKISNLGHAGVATPWMVDPRPNSYIGEFRDDFPDLDYQGGTLSIEGLGKF